MTIDYDFHNPDNLTPTQVGDGYRLLLKSEIKKRSFSREIQKWDRIENKWWQTSFQGSNIDSTYRVPLATWPLPEPDPYAELKAAQAAGKVVEFNPGDSLGWRAQTVDWTAPVECYRIKPEEPEWTLGNSVNGFTLSEGQQWHRLDWTREMLPKGWRPLIIGETPQDNDDYFTGIVWRVRSTGYDAISFGRGWLHHRTRRPLPTPAPNYACPPVKHPEAKELQDRFAEPAWISWHGGECPLKDDEVEEWECQFRSGRVKIVKDHPSSFLWTQGDWSADIIAYRVLKWKSLPMKTNLPPESCPACGASEVASNGPRTTYACGSSDYDQRPNTFKQASSCLSSVKEPAPTDNDVWNNLLATNAQLNTKVAELEGWKNQAELVESEWNAHEVAKLLDLPLGKSIRKGIMEQLPLLLVKLTAAEARLKQLEWVPFSERKPTKEDADENELVCVTNDKTIRLVGFYAYTTATHWRPFAPPAPIDTDRVAFEKWWNSSGFDRIMNAETAFQCWKAARAKEEKL